MKPSVLTATDRPARSASDLDPEVPAKARRRRFRAKYKLKILAEVDQCSQPGEIGKLLRREGLYSSHLSKWRAQREAGALEGLRPKKRGRKARQVDPQARRVVLTPRSASSSASDFDVIERPRSASFAGGSMDQSTQDLVISRGALSPEIWGLSRCSAPPTVTARSSSHRPHRWRGRPALRATKRRHTQHCRKGTNSSKKVSQNH